MAGDGAAKAPFAPAVAAATRPQIPSVRAPTPAAPAPAPPAKAAAAAAGDEEESPRRHAVARAARALPPARMLLLVVDVGGLCAGVMRSRVRPHGAWRPYFAAVVSLL